MPCTGELTYDESMKDASNNAAIKNNYTNYCNNGAEDYKVDCKLISPTTPEETNIQTTILSSNNSIAQIQSQNEQICRYRTPSTRSLLNPSLSFNALHPLPGEEFESENWVDLCHCQLFLTQFRIIIVTHSHNAACAIPLLNVESIEAKEIVGLHILCKDGRIIRIQAENSETAIAWYKKLIQVTCVARKLDDLFTFKFHKTIFKHKLMNWIRKDVEKRHYSSLEALAREYKHLDLKEISWKVTTVNENFELCSTYPQYLIVPSSVSNEELLNMRQARFHNRFPTLVWRSKRTGALLYRSSQPTVGFFGMSNEYDVKLYEKMKSITNSEKQSKFLIMDARSYTAAWANRAKGGGFETSDAYKDAEVVFMGLPNIHNIRYSFHQLRLLLNSPNDQNTYLQTLQSTMWLQNIGCLFSATERCLNALCYDGISVLVHCSDGWDRTTQIVSLSMLIADSYYRTFEGFEMLIQRQWIEFGHKFGDRSGVLNGDENERSPVFLQFLDCVYQLWMKNPDAFEFNRRYLMKLVQHTYSGLFSSFLFNSVKESIKAGCTQPDKAAEPHRISISSIDIKANGTTNNSDDHKQLRAFPIWDYLGKHNYEFINPAYNVKYAHQKTMLVFPKLMSEFELWRDAYCCTPAQTCINNPETVSPSSTTITPNTTSSALNNTSGSVSSHEGALEKVASTLSRSQSASSLTSLEQNTSGIQPLHISSHHNTSMPSHPVGSIGSTNSNISSYMTRMSDNSTISEWHSQNYLDVDGLSKVPIVFEDRVVEMHREFLHLELQTNNNKRMGTSDAIHYRDFNGGRYSTLNTEQHPNGTTTTTTNTTVNLLTNNGTNGYVNNSFSTNNGAAGTPSNTNFILNGSPTTTTTTTTRRVRNESIDSTSLGFEFIDDFDPCSMKRKHDSSGNSSACSTFTLLNECNGGCKNMMRAHMSSLNSDNNSNGRSAEDKSALYGSVEEVHSQCHSNGGGQLVVG